MKSLIKSFIIFYELLRSFVLVIFHFLLWTLTNKVARIVFLLVVISLGSWIGGFSVFVKNIDKTRSEIIMDTPNFNDTTEAIVVLTGGSERIKHALFLLNMGFANKLFISGVNKEVKLHELMVLHGYNAQQEVAMSGRIELGYTAVDTIQNAQEIADWVKKNNIKSIRLVTSNYHIKRAMLEIQDVLPDVKIIPYGVVPLNIRLDRWWAYPPTRELLISEYNKYLAANLRIFLEKFGI